VSDDEDHTVTDQLLGGGDRLLGITEVVRRDEAYLLAEHAAGGIEVGHGQLCTALQLLAVPGKGAGNRAGHTNQDLRPSGPAKRGCKHDNGYGD
jgi:hypothetical protein